MTKYKKHIHPIRCFTCMLAMSALTLSTASTEILPANAAVHTDTQAAYAFSQISIQEWSSGPLLRTNKSAVDVALAHLGEVSDVDCGKREAHVGQAIAGKTELSLEDAVALAQKEADRYYDDLHLTNVYSYDNDRMCRMSSGSDGKREWWYVNFANKQENYVSVLIADGAVLDAVHFDSNANSGLFDLSDVKLSAAQAVKKARALGLRGGNPQAEEEWVSGFNFKISYESLVVSPDDIRLFFEVIGISPNGNFAHVDFDAVTGELLLAEEKIEYENGDTEWRKF